MVENGTTKMKGVRINRNILECKYPTFSNSLYSLYVLIETYWNVNSYTLEIPMLFYWY